MTHFGALTQSFGNHSNKIPQALGPAGIVPFFSVSLCVSALKGRFDLSVLSARWGWSRRDYVRPHQEWLRIAEAILHLSLGLKWIV